MPSITLSVPEEVKVLMKKFPEVNWSALIRQSITQKAQQLLLKQKFLGELNKEKEFNNWAVNLVREGRKK